MGGAAVLEARGAVGSIARAYAEISARGSSNPTDSKRAWTSALADQSGVRVGCSVAAEVGEDDIEVVDVDEAVVIGEVDG